MMEKKTEERKKKKERRKTKLEFSCSIFLTVRRTNEILRGYFT